MGLHIGENGGIFYSLCGGREIWALRRGLAGCDGLRMALVQRVPWRRWLPAISKENTTFAKVSRFDTVEIWHFATALRRLMLAPGIRCSASPAKAGAQEKGRRVRAIALRYLHLRYWAPAFAGEAMRGKRWLQRSAATRWRLDDGLHTPEANFHFQVGVNRVVSRRCAASRPTNILHAFGQTIPAELRSTVSLHSGTKRLGGQID